MTVSSVQLDLLNLRRAVDPVSPKIPRSSLNSRLPFTTSTNATNKDFPIRQANTHICEPDHVHGPILDFLSGPISFKSRVLRYCISALLSKYNG